MIIFAGICREQGTKNCWNLGKGEVGNGFSMLYVRGNGRTLRREREKKRERKRSLIIISLIAFYGSLNALGSHSGS